MTTPPQLARHNAFISYRHVPRDRKWAKWLHRKLETYRTPRSLVALGKAKRLNRVFRDEEELPVSGNLSASIKSELGASEYLIVICSPETVESKWVNAEIEHFQSLGRGDHILPILISGTPESSFPSALRRSKAESSENEDLPLAGQLPTKPFSYFERRLALLKLFATLLDCRFDDLRRRHEQRRRRRIVMISAVVFTILIASVVALWRSERSRIEQLITDSQTWSQRDASRSLLLSRLAFDRARRLESITTWFGIARDESVRAALEAAIYNSRLRGEFQMRSQPVQAVAWERQHLVAGDYNGNVNVWDRFSGILTAHHSFPNGIQGIVVQARNGSPTIVMITGQVKKIGGATILTPESAIKDLLVWNITSDVVRSKRLSSDELLQYQASLSRCQEDNRVVVSIGLERAWVVNIEGNEPMIVAELPGAEKPEVWRSGIINAVRWNPDCTAIAVATTFEVFTWPIGTGNGTHVEKEQSDIVNSSPVQAMGILAIDWNQKGSLAFGGQDNIVRVDRQFLSGHQAPVRVVRWNHAGDRLATSGEDGVIRIWERSEDSMQFRTVIGFYANQGEQIFDLAWSPNDSELASVGADNTIRIWNVLPEETVLSPASGGTRHLDDYGRWTYIDEPLTDVRLAELARERTFRLLTAKECEVFLRSSTCPTMRGANN